MTMPTVFSPDYQSARTRFREAAARLNWHLESQPVTGHGPQGEDLTIDVAASSATPQPSQSRTLILSSGLHGVEGFFGSAVQLAFLERAAELPASVRCVLIHGLNPHGFAWGRRFDAENIDPNRNFLLPGEEFAGCPQGYPRLHPLLNPQRPLSRWEPFYLKALANILRYGMPALRQAIAAGQYDYPQGLFFGGHGPGRTQLILDRHMRRWIGDTHTAVHLDFHTGLGARGTCKLLMDGPLSSTDRDRLTNWFGEHAFDESHATTIAYAARGGWGPWCVQRCFARSYLFACAEFGTYGPVTMLRGLRAENQAHHWCDPASIDVIQTRKQLRELFCPASPRWRHEVIQRSHELIDRTLHGLAAEPPVA